VRKRLHNSLKRGCPCGHRHSAVPALFAQAGPGFNTTVPSQIMDQFRSERVQWTANVFIYASTLSGVLALIEFAWSAAVMLFGEERPSVLDLRADSKANVDWTVLRFAFERSRHDPRGRAP